MNVRTVSIAALIISLSTVCNAKTHKDTYNVPCEKVWPAVVDVLKTSGKYKVVSIDSPTFTASFSVGAYWTGTALNTATLNPVEKGCALWVNSAFRGITHNDAGDFKLRVDNVLGLSKPSKPVDNPPVY